MMKHLLQQTTDPQIEEGLRETRPFIFFMILVLSFLYGVSLYADPLLRRPGRLIPYTFLFILHIALHWFMPRLVVQRGRLAAYLLVQLLLIIAIIAISRQQGVVAGLFMSMAGETIGILEDWPRGVAATIVYLLLMAAAFIWLWGWREAFNWVGGGLLVLLFVLIYVLLFVRQLNARAESQRLLTELQGAHKQLAVYAQQVESLTLEAERQRMARELHDTLAGGLAGLVLQLEALEANLERAQINKAATIAGQAKERARHTLADARRAIDDLRANDMNVSEAINREVRRFITATGIPCTLEIPSPLNITMENGAHLVRAVTEGLTNIARHARATAARVTIRSAGGNLHLEIFDDGRGFDSEKRVPAGHFGLIGLRERARLAGGRVDIASAPGGGTTLTMSVPYGEPDAGLRVDMER